MTNICIAALGVLGLSCLCMQAIGRDSADGPKLFGEGVVSLPGTVGITFSPDGGLAYFARMDGTLKRWVILQSGNEAGKWTLPSPAAFSGNTHDGGPSLSPDGRQMFFWSLRPSGGITPQQSRLWVVDRVGNGWGQPRDLGAPINVPDRPSANACATADGTLYFVTKREDALGSDDIYRARRSSNGAYEQIENVGAAVNSPQHEFDVYVSPNEDYMLFSSNRPGGVGKSDIYATSRVNGVWTAPRSLGTEVNSPETELAPRVSPDGLTLFFTRIGGSSPGIYKVDAARVGIAPLRIARPQ